MLLAILLAFTLPLKLLARERVGSNIPLGKVPQQRTRPFPFKWPPPTRLDPLSFKFNELTGHYMHKNKISPNAGLKNVRDGMYIRMYIRTWGGEMRRYSSADDHLTISSTDAEIGKDETAGALGCLFGPPTKLRNLRNYLLLLSSRTGTQWNCGRCTLYASFLNMHRSRLAGVYVKAFPAESLSGVYEYTIPEPTLYWRTRQWKFFTAEVSNYDHDALSNLLNHGKPFEIAITKGYYRRADVEFGNNRRTLWVPLHAFVVVAGLICAKTAVLIFEFIPFIFPGFGDQKKKKKPFQVQEAVLIFELIPNLATMLDDLVGITGWFPAMFIKNMEGSWRGHVGFFFFFWRGAATTTTMLMAMMWMNESEAAAQMRQAKPIVQFAPKRLIAIFLFVTGEAVLEFICLGFTFGAPIDVTALLCWFVLPFVSFCCAVFFQINAGKLATSLTGENPTLVAFRKKMVKNLVRGGFFDIVAFFMAPILWSMPLYGQKDFYWKMAVNQYFRNVVSHFQILSIEPAAAVKARNDKRKALASKVTSRLSMTSTSSMSSDASSMSSSTSSASESSTSDSTSTDATSISSSA